MQYDKTSTAKKTDDDDRDAQKFQATCIRHVCISVSIVHLGDATLIHPSAAARPG
jgi:hypothetical protein